MSANTSLVTSLVDRLVTRLPHRTGSSSADLELDHFASLTRDTLIDISATNIVVVTETVLQLIEDLSRPYKSASSHPPHILRSGLYLVHLLADCCTAHWNVRNSHNGNNNDGFLDNVNYTEDKNRRPSQRLLSGSHSRLEPPIALDDSLTARFLAAVRKFLSPIPEDFVMPASSILHEGPAIGDLENVSEAMSQDLMLEGDRGRLDPLHTKVEDVEVHIRSIIEFLSASNWAYMMEFITNELRGPHANNTGQAGGLQSLHTTEEDRKLLVSFRFIAMLSVDAKRLGFVIQEVCANFLHFRKPFQHTIAIVLPLLVTRWIEQNPQDFVAFHLQHKRLDGGADTLFDMTTTNTMTDQVKLKTVLFPLQMTLLFLLPDVWSVASGIREAKSSSMSKKVAYLESLRKGVRNNNETAAYCLVSLLRVARHFGVDSDSTLLSYALDVEDEVREAMFRRPSAGSEAGLFSTGLLTAAFVSIVHLDLESSAETFAPLCLDTNAPRAFQIAFVSACCHFARRHDPSVYHCYYIQLSSFIREHFKASAISRQARERDGVAEESHVPSASDNLIFHMLTFLDLQPLNIYIGAPDESLERERFFDDNFKAFVSCLTIKDDRISTLASAVAERVCVAITSAMLGQNNGSLTKNFQARFWRSTSIVIITVCNKILSTSQQEKSTLDFLRGYLKTRLDLMKMSKELANIEIEIPERTLAQEKLETVFLISLCSPEIERGELTTRCIALMCEESIFCTSKFSAASKGGSQMPDIDAYLEFSSKDFRFTGLVAFQKRVRTMLRRLKQPSPGILEAWGIAFRRWLQLSKLIAIDRISTNSSERTQTEWRNFSGFLASLGGLCTSEHASVIDETGLVGLKWIDRQALEDYDESFLGRYLTQSIQLLGSANVRAREATREVLSTEIAPALYLHLFRNLEAELEAMFDNSQAGSLSSEAHSIFAEQAASLLKSLLERFGGTEALPALSIDVGALVLNFVRFVDHGQENLPTLRIKLKLCQLCETVTQKKELLNLRHDVRVRNKLLDLIFRWIARPGTPLDGSSGTRLDEMQKLQRDLDRACLKALVDLTYRLPLQPPEGQSDAETSDTKVLLFRTYFNRFLSLLSVDIRESSDGSSNSRDDPISIHELAIQALSNLLSANIDISLRHCLSIGYNEDILIRTAFVRVLCNVLAQGSTDFHNLSDAAMTEKYDTLLRLLIDNNTLTIALCDACPSSEVDELAVSLLNIFESRGLGFTLLQTLIEHEVEETENEAELLRRNCVATKILSIYAKWKGSSYLKGTLQSVLERLLVTAKDLDLELDPARTSSEQSREKNALQLRYVAKVFIDDICKSAAHIPVSFRSICNIISTAVMTRFPDAKFTAVGAFIFLRFFCPAIVAPDSEGLINSPPSKEMRRGLLLIAKVVQNLANNVLFGAKESYMFPLNDFLTENIYRVTTFLREISTASISSDASANMASFDFGSSVALHRFLYDHWDHVRQKLTVSQRKVSVQSPTEASQGYLPIVELLRELVSKLGPPPTDISWNRPMISSNSPPSYCRFQHFMLRNSGRSNESLVTSHAVYDGGESKDGLSIICIILRKIDVDKIDFELLLYCYLKIASRMWQKPFGLLIDATCYNGQHEPQDALFRTLDLLTPSELYKNLSRVYVYNMNSAFRKCFRRILRLSSKSDLSAFHPTNVDYHLIGSLPELQSHFHLGQLNLPKETISMVTDTRFVFQPVTRLSKTKGKIEVVIKVGSQFVQVTTTQKQEIVPVRLHATVNDIFRLSEVDEAPTSIQTEDDSAFGLRTESGKIVMYFTSPKRNDIVTAIRNAKMKHGKDFKHSATFERLIRPQDVPGTLLNIAFTNMASSDAALRLSSYNLLSALCLAFDFAPDDKFVSAQELAVPRNASRFIIQTSKHLAASEPQLTAEFLNEFFVGWESFPLHQRPLSLSYMAPWLPSLRTQVMVKEAEGDKAKEKILAVLRRLLDVALSDPSLGVVLEQSVWPSICHDESMAELFLEELIKTAMGFGPEDDRVDLLGSIVASTGTITTRGRLLSKLRKALNRTSLRPTRRLADNNVWPEICVYVRLCLSLSFDSGVQSQLFLPELFHIITMLVNTGRLEMKVCVHRLLVNTIHALYTTFTLEDTRMTRLKNILMLLTDIHGHAILQETGFTGDALLLVQSHDATTALASTEALTILLSEVTVIAAPTVDLSNGWRSRWMSLVASTAFQSNPAIQPRSFAIMGCLAREDVDDDLLYQVLVALRNSVNRMIDDNDHEMLVAIVTSLTKMMEKLPTASRYGLQLFWLALSLVRLVPLALFNCAALLLDSALRNINTSGEFKDGKMVTTLLQGRQLVEEIAVLLDESYGVYFNVENFHFAICASLIKGLSDTVTKGTTLKLFRTFLEITCSNAGKDQSFPEDVFLFPYLAILISRAPTADDAREVLWLAGVDLQGQSPEDTLAMVDLRTIKDKELLLNAALSLIDFRFLGDYVQDKELDWLNAIALERPTVILHLYKPVLHVLDEVLLTCQNSLTLESAHQLLRTMTSNPKLAGRVDTEELLEVVLEDIGFGGLWQCSSFHGSSEVIRRRTQLADKLIELIIA